MRRYKGQDIQAALAAAGIKPGDAVYMHGSLVALGAFEGADPSRMPERVLSEVLAYLSQEGTLVMPTYNYTFPRIGHIDLRAAPSEVGSLSEAMRSVAGAVCSGHAMFRHHGAGRLAESVLCPDVPELNAFSSTSAFQRMTEHKFKLCFLGASFDVNTYTVFAEYQCGVRYRFNKAFEGEVVLQSGRRVKDAFIHFCMPRTGELAPNFSRIHDVMAQSGTLGVSSLGMGKVRCVSMREYLATVKAQLALDPWCLLESAPQRLWAMVDGEERVVANLKGHFE